MLRTILLEPKEETDPPPLVSEYQWGDMSNYPDYAAQGEDVFQEYINKQADSIIAMLKGNEIRQYNGEISYIREKLGLPEIPPLSKFDLLIQKPMIGRKWLNEEIETWVNAPSASRVMMIYGNPGVGKSMYAAHLQHYSPHTAAAIACDYHSDEYSTSDRVTIWLAYKLALRLPDYRRWLMHQFSDSRFEIKSGKDLVDQFLLQPFSLGIINGQRSTYFIIIDALDEARASDFSEYILNFINDTARHAPWLRFIITAREEPHILERFGRFPAIRFDENLNNNSNDIREYYDFMLKPLLIDGEAEIGGIQFKAPPSVRRFTEEDFSAFADRLTEASRGVFVYAEKVYINIADDFISGRITALPEYPLPDGISDLFRDTLDRKFNKESEHYQFAPYTMRDFEEKFSEPLGMVMASPKPLPATTLIKLMDWNEKQYNSFMFCFGTVLDEKEGSLTPFHKSFSEWLNMTRTRYNTPLSDGIAHLALTVYRVYTSGIDRLDEFLTVNLTRILRSAAENSDSSEYSEYYDQAVNDKALTDKMLDIGDNYKEHNRFTDAGEIYVELIGIFKADIGEDTDIKSFDEGRINFYCLALYGYGNIMKAQNKFIDAESYYQKALYIITKLTEAYPENPQYKRGLSVSLDDVADIKQTQNDLSAALKLYEKSREIWGELADACSENPDYKRGLSLLLERIADIKIIQNDLSAALEFYEKSREILKPLADAYPENPQYKRDLSVSLERIADIKKAQNNLSAALKLYEKSSEILKPLADAYLENPEYKRDLSVSLERIADIKQAQNDLSAALKLYEETLQIAKELADAYPENPQYKRDLSVSLNRVADIKQAQNDLSAALKLYEEALKIARELSDTYPKNPEYKRDLSVSLGSIADIRKAQNDLPAALEFYEKSSKIWKQLADAYPENPGYKRGLTISLGSIADIKKLSMICLRHWSSMKKVVRFGNNLQMPTQRILIIKKVCPFHYIRLPSYTKYLAGVKTVKYH